MGTKHQINLKNFIKMTKFTYFEREVLNWFKVSKLTNLKIH